MANSLDANQVQLARSLVNPEKSVRDETCSSLTSLIKNTSSMTELEMLKLWKALYYCLWLADKPDVQSELALYICGLIPQFPSVQLMILSIRIFYRTMLREWPHLDQYRIDKFYKIIRYMLRSNLSYLHGKSWPVDLTNQAISCLEEEILVKTPNGIRFHVADIFLEELYVATEGAVRTPEFLLLLAPFFRSIAAANDPVFRDRVHQNIFSKYLGKYARELASKIESLPDGEEQITLFKNVDTRHVQNAVFELASGDQIKEGNRKKTYALHARFQPVTGEAFIDASSLTIAATPLEELSSAPSRKKATPKSASVENKPEVPEASTEEPETSSRKRKPRATASSTAIASAPVGAPATQEVIVEPEQPKRKAAKKGSKASPEEAPASTPVPTPAPAPASAPAPAKPVTRKSKAVEVAEPAEVAVQEQPKKAKSKSAAKSAVSAEEDPVEAPSSKKNVRFSAKLAMPPTPSPALPKAAEEAVGQIKSILRKRKA